MCRRVIGNDILPMYVYVYHQIETDCLFITFAYVSLTLLCDWFLILMATK